MSRHIYFRVILHFTAISCISFIAAPKISEASTGPLFSPSPALTLSSTASLSIHEINRVQRLFSQWQYDLAIDEAETLFRKYPDNPRARALAARAEFYRQNYQESVNLFTGIETELGRMDESYLSFAGASLETLDYVTETSENFEIRVPPGADEILIPYALDALEKAYASIGAVFDFFPERRIVVEVYTRPEKLSAASGLPVEAIRNTGTVAVCKHNKIMIMTPRSLLMGYTWLDTLSHEYVHYVVSRVSDNTVPIWLHEGLAKYLETKWQGEAGLAMSPYAEGLLEEAVKGDREFITFEEMHPSMALLPSREHSALAFAQVFSVVQYIVSNAGGYPALFKITQEMKDGKTDREAIEAATGITFERFIADWKKWLERRPSGTHVHAYADTRRYADEVRGRAPSTAEEDLDADSNLEDSDAEKHTRLGDLLRIRKRYKASIIQYEKAYAIAGPSTPRLPNRLAATLILTENKDRAEEVLKEAIAPSPNYPTTHVQLGRIYLSSERWDEAEKALLHANSINPFDPQVHAGLLAVYRQRQDSDGIEQSERALALLYREMHRRR